MNETAREEKEIRRRPVYHGRVVTLHVDSVELGNGRTSEREIVEHPGGSGILALTEKEEIFLVRQYRYAFHCFLDEIPAGKREHGEDPFVTARRELKEEIGASAGRWVELGSSLSSPGCFTERIFLYAAFDLEMGAQQLDPDESLSVRRVPFEEAYRMVMDGKILDAKTQLAILKYAAMRKTQSF